MNNKYTNGIIKMALFVLVIGTNYNSYAQEEFKDKFKAVPPKEKNLKIEVKTPKDPGPPQIIPYVAAPIPENIFKVPKSDIIIAAEVYRRNQDLGIFKTTSKTAMIRYRDAAYVDGDRIRIYVNFKVVDYEVLLDSYFKGFEIKLEKGVNRIDFEALNEGFASPNTAEFEVYDDKGKILSSSQWNIGTGYKATIIVDKE